MMKRCPNGFLPFLCLACCGESAHEPIAVDGNASPTLRAVSFPNSSAGRGALEHSPAGAPFETSISAPLLPCPTSMEHDP